MKSVSFLRNTWKKWESKTSDSRSNTENTNSQDSRKPPSPRSQTKNQRSLTITVVKNIPLDTPRTFAFDDSQIPLEDSSFQSPMREQFTQGRSDLTFMRRYNSHITLDVIARDSERTPIPPTKSLRHTASNLVAPQTVSTQTLVAHHGPEHSPSSPRHSSSPRKPAISLQSAPPPSFRLLPPIELDYGPSSEFERSLEASPCNCMRSSPQSRHHPSCPNYAPSGVISRVSSREILVGHHPQKSDHAVLDKSLNPSSRSLYHRTGSTPHLPFIERSPRSTRLATSSEYSTLSETSDTANFPLSLFPAPPPLIVRKKIPAPLVLRPMQSSSSQSSVDSTPIGTPTTPRNPCFHTPSQSSITSPNKKHFLLRQSTGLSPPPFSPPSSPLPSVPPSPDCIGWSADSHRSPEHRCRTLRHTQSNTNLRDTLPHPATHRLTSSEPISDKSSLSAKKPSAKARPEAIRSVKDLKGYMELPEPSVISTDAYVQWGYAL